MIHSGVGLDIAAFCTTSCLAVQAAERPARIKILQPSGVVAMGSFSLMHWIVVLAIILILFGAGKLPRVMGDFAKGIKAFKAGMKEEDEAETAPPAQVPPPGTATGSPASAGVAASSPGAVGAADRPREHV
jgi:sec-independent protein translocase protein TatA